MAAMPGLVKRGLGANAIINYLKPQGLTYRRVAMLADIRKFTGLAKLEHAVKATAGDVLFPRYAMVETEFRSARRYYVQARMTILDEDSLEESVRWVSFYSNTRMSKDQWTEAFVRGYAEGKYGEAEQILDVTIASVSHKRGWAH
jgi:hypothetical protein